MSLAALVLLLAFAVTAGCGGQGGEAATDAVASAALGDSQGSADGTDPIGSVTGDDAADTGSATDALGGGDGKGAAGVADIACTQDTPDRWPSGAADRDSSGKVITFGQSASLEGTPASALGVGMKEGVRIAFYEQNTQGGVDGHSLELVSLNDCYEPNPARNNTIRLIEEFGVFALIGATGTPTSEVAAPAAAKLEVPYIGPFTGAHLLRDEDDDNMRYVVNFRASYVQETAKMVEYLDSLGIDRVAVVFQDDSYGREGYRGVVKALEEFHGNKPTAIAYYTRNTTIVKGAVLDLQAGEPEAVIIIGAYQPTASLIRWSRRIGFNPVFMSVSFVGADALVAEFSVNDDDFVGFDDASDGVGVYITQVVPFPYTPEGAETRDIDDARGVDADGSASTRSGSADIGRYSEVVRAYNRALESYREGHPGEDLEPGFVSFEGYLAGRLAIKGLESCDLDVGLNELRACFLGRIVNSPDPIDIEDMQLVFDDNEGFDNQGSNEVFITMIDEYGELVPLSEDSTGASG